MVITVNCINMIVPFIWYQKLQVIATKYMYIIDKYGYLTSREEQQMITDMKQDGFDTSYVTISVPKTKQPYGKLINLEIKYIITHNVLTLNAKTIKTISVVVKKYSYSKI